MSIWGGNDVSRKLKKQWTIPIANYTDTQAGTAVEITGMAGTAVNINLYLGTVTTGDASNYFTISVTQGTTNTAATAVDSAQLDPIDSWDYLINDTAETDSFETINFIVKPDYDWLKVTATKTLGSPDATFGVSVEFETKSSPYITT